MFKKLILFLFPIIAFSNINDDFFNLSEKYIKSYVTNNNFDLKKLSSNLNELDQKKFEKLKYNIKEIEKLFNRVYKTNKNLVPKIIKYIYFEPFDTNDENIINEEIQKILLSFYANNEAKIFINNQFKNAIFFEKILIEKGANKENILVINDTTKNIINKITDFINIDFNGKNKFSIIENRVLIITSSNLIKEKLALATSLFNNKFEGIEVDDFSYLVDNRNKIEKINTEDKLIMFKQAIEAIK